MNFDAVVFDMDGLLLDTERIAQATFIESCQDLAAPFSMEVYLRIIGGNAAHTREVFFAEYGAAFPYDQVRARWLEKYAAKALHQQVPLKEGAPELIAMLHRSGIPIAVATSTAYEHAVTKLRNAGLHHYFQFVVAGDQVTYSKPHPEIYTKAVTRLALDPARCLALEDSENGVRAAHAAGMFVIQVPDLVPPSEGLKALGHTIVDNLHLVHAYFI